MGHPSLRRAEVCVSDEVDRPSVIGFFAPKILIPSWLLEKLTKDELRQIVLHEAGHLGRADDWMNLVQKIALVVFPLNPALAWVERRLCFERELACDERVLGAGGADAPRTYAACLVTLAEHRLGRRRGMALSLGALGRESELGQRVRRILAGGGRMRAAQARLVLGGAMLGLAVGAVELERCPQMVAFSGIRDQGTGIRERAGVAQNAALVRGGMKGFGMEAVVFRPDAGVNGTLGVVSGTNMSRGLKPNNSERSMMSLRPTAKAVGYQPGPISETKAASVPGSITTTRAVSFSERKVAAGLNPTHRDRAAMSGAPGSGDEPRNSVGWVVVTAWDGADGSRMVLTTMDTSLAMSDETPGGDVRGDVPRQGQGEMPQRSWEMEQDHRYAAVPVRGGWLVIQL